MKSFERTYNLLEATMHWKEETLGDILLKDFVKVAKDSSDEKYITVKYELSGNKYLINKGDLT